jgi:hypothetical protein
VTEVHVITEWEFKRRIAHWPVPRHRLDPFATMQPEQTAAEKANDKIEGKKCPRQRGR